MKCNLVHILCYPGSKPSSDRSTVGPRYLQYSLTQIPRPTWTICIFPPTWLTLVLPSITQIDFHLQWVFQILTLTFIMLHISCRLRKELYFCAYLVHWEEKEYSNHAMPINLWRSKFHSGTRFFSTLFFWKNCTSCPVEGTQKLA